MTDFSFWDELWPVFVVPAKFNSEKHCSCLAATTVLLARIQVN